MPASAAWSQAIKIGSKNFNESQILAEIMAQILEDRRFEVERKFGLGGTLICYRALVNGEIDLYPEYSGTIEQAILKLSQSVSYEELQSLLRQKYDLELLPSFGFNNTYALAARENFAEKHDLSKISDLKDRSGLNYGLSYEFIERGDGWYALADYYDLQASPTGMEHTLAYRALARGKIDIMDVYSTDAEIRKYDLALLEDDKKFFPEYLAAPLARTDLPQRAKNVLALLADKLDETEMQNLNAQVAIAGKTFAEAARAFLIKNKLVRDVGAAAQTNRWSDLAQKTLDHIFLVVIAMSAAILIAVPLGMLIYKLRRISGPVIYFTGLMQTIPSLALLALMIPLFGIGVKPGLVALFLYALLPILRNTYTALTSIDPILKRVSVGMGLTAWQRLRHIELPLAMPTVLAGIRTATVLVIGTATIAAFIGAGGLGEYIFTGMSLNDVCLIMWGAIPAALLAILGELFFEGLERWTIPRHLRQGEH